MPEAIPINRSDLRLSLWEVDPCFRCPVVGACLTHREQLSLLKKSANSFADAASYEIHETLVSATGSENHLSRRIDSLLQRKYARDAAENLALAPDAFVERFREALPSERMAAMLWVAAVRRDLDFEQKREIFGELHMAMHESLGGRLQAERKLERVEKESEALRLELRQAVAERRTLQKEMDVCRRELMQSQSALASAESDLNRLKGELEARKRQECDSAKAEASGELIEMREAFARMQVRLTDAAQYATALEEENSGLSRQLERLRDASRQFDQLQSSLPNFQNFSNPPKSHSYPRATVSDAPDASSGFPQCQKCDETCPVSDLCQKRILIVGGIERMESRYRRLIEEGGGVMEYHDGHVSKGAHELECCLRRADMVLCPINCNSHAACLIIKKLGKKHRKPVCMLPNFSLSAVSRAIWNKDRTGAIN